MILDIKPHTAIREIDISYRNSVKPSDFPKVGTSKDVYDLLMGSWDMDKIELQEQFRVMLIDNKSRCMGVATVSTGGISNCFVDLRLVFGLALKARASGIVLSHNHPSGVTAPSEEDKRLTTRFAIAGRYLDLPIMDHIIVSREGYTSFVDEGIVFKTKG